MIKLNRRSALRARASVLAMLTGLTLAQQAHAISPIVVTPSYPNCTVSVNNQTVSANGSGQSVLIQSGAVIGDLSTPGLDISGSTLSGSIVNNGKVFYGPPGCSGFGGQSFGAAAISIFDTTVIGGVFNNKNIDSSGDGIAIVSSQLGATNGSHTATIFENTDEITGDNIGVFFQSSSVIGTIKNSNYIRGGQTGMAFENSTVSGSVANTGIINSFDENGLQFVDTIVTGGVTNGQFAQLKGSTLSGAGLMIGGTTTFGAGFSNLGSVTGLYGVHVAGNSYTGGLYNNGQGKIEGDDSGIFVTTAVFNGNIENRDSGKITGETGYGILIDQNNISQLGEGQPHEFNGSIFNDYGATISGVQGGIRVDTGVMDGGLANYGSIALDPDNSQVTSLVAGPHAAAWFHADQIFGAFENFSSIDGSSQSGAHGLVISGGRFSGSVTNHSTIKGSNLSGGAGLLIAVNQMTGSVTNLSTISGDIALQIGPDIFSTTSLTLNGLDLRGDIDNQGSLNGKFKGLAIHANTMTGSITNAANAFISADGSDEGKKGLDAYFNLFDGNFTNNGTINDGARITAASWTGDLTTGASSSIFNASGVGFEITGPRAQTAALSDAVTDSLLDWQGAATLRGTFTGTNAAAMSIDANSFSGSLTNYARLSGSVGLHILANTWNGAFTNEVGGQILGTDTGLFFQANDVTGKFTNRGTIHGDGLDTGWHIIADNFANDIENAAGGVLEAPENALHVEITNMSGSVLNNGTITGGANIAIDIWNGSFKTGLNSSITSSATAGLQIGGRSQQTAALESNGLDWVGDFENKGHISSSAKDGAHIAVHSFSGSFTNSGTMSGGGQSSSGLLIIATSNWHGDWTNASGGSISGPETGFAFIGENVTGTFTNNGSITGGGVNTGWLFQAAQLDGDLVNNGTLEALSNTWHVQVGQLNGDVKNTNIITATASNGVGVLLQGNGSGSAYTGKFSNSGVITGGSTSGTALKIEVSLADGVENTGTLRGKTAYDSTGAKGAVAFTQSGANALVDGDMKLSQDYADTVTFKDGELRGSIQGNGETADDSVIVNVAALDSFGFENNSVNNVAEFIARSGTTLLGTKTAGVNGGGTTINTESFTVESGASLYLDDNAVVNTNSFDMADNTSLTYYLTTNVNQHGVINVLGSSASSFGFGNKDIPGPQSFSALAVQGGATVGNNVNLQLNLSDFDAFRTSGQNQFLYTGVLSTANGITGTFNPAVFVGGVPLGFQYQVSALYNTPQNPTSVDILISRTPFTNLIDAPSGNQGEVGGGLEQLCQNAASGSVAAQFCDYVATLGEDDIPGAFDQVGGSEVTSTIFSGFDLGELLTRFANETNVGGTVGMICNQDAGIGGWCGLSGKYAALDGNVATDATNDADPFAWLRTGQRKPGKTAAWLRYVGNFRDVEGDANARGLRSNTNGAAGGIDKVFSEQLMVGVAGLYTNTNTKFSGAPSNKSDIDTYQLGVYASLGDSNLYLNVNSTVIWNDFDTRRRIDSKGGPVYADGSFQGLGGTAYAELGTVLDSEGFRFQPVGALFYLTHHTDAFEETGAGNLGLRIGSASKTSLRSSLGGRLAYPMQFDGTRLIPELRGAWQHEYLDTNQTISAQFLDLDPKSDPFMRIVGANTARDNAQFGGGISANFEDSLTVYFDADVSFNADKTSSIVALGLRKSW